MSHTKTYEYAYSIPGAGTLGFWDAEILAHEGTEGTVTDAGVASIEVVATPSPTLDTSTKSVVDLNGGDELPGCRNEQLYILRLRCEQYGIPQYFEHHGTR